jgi:ABC-type transporter Mla MlaB component
MRRPATGPHRRHPRTHTSSSPSCKAALNIPVIIEQAKGMLAEYLTMTVDDAFTVLTGPVISSTGADLTSVAQLTDALTAQTSGGARHLTVDLAQLRSADSAAIRALVPTDRTMKGCGSLELIHPQLAVARL